MEIKFKKLDPRAVAPVRGHESDAGFDLVATRITTEINECGQLILVYHTDIAVEIPEGFFGLLTPRSSISKKSLTLTNSAGVIDSGYRGEVMAKFKVTTDVIPAVYKEGERFAQLLILPVPAVTFEEAFELSDSDRGEGGYGSTGDGVIDKVSAPTGSAESQNIVEEQAEQTAPEVAAGDVKTPEQAQ
jgi:dUTP pyrophosphatase